VIKISANRRQELEIRNQKLKCKIVEAPSTLLRAGPSGGYLNRFLRYVSFAPWAQAARGQAHSGRNDGCFIE